MLARLGLHATDATALLLHVASFVVYGLVHRRRALRDPSVTLQAQQRAVRRAWIDEVLSTHNGILGVQTLRNLTTATLFFASNSIFLVFGVLTLASQSGLREAFDILSVGEASPHLTQLNLALLLFTLRAAFFAFISAIRMFSHASVSIGLSGIEPKRVVAQIEAAWRYHALGIRSYYFAAPLLCWLFGTPWLVLADAAAIVLMHVFDDASLER